MSVDDGFEGFCVQEWPRLVRVLGGFLGDRGVAEDLAQETMIRVADRWRTVRELDSPAAWAHRVGLNLAVSHARRRRAERRAYERSDSGSEARYGDIAAAVAVRAALAELDEKECAAVVLRYMVDLSAAEVGSALAMSAEAVRVLTHRVLADLRRQLGEQESKDTEVCA